MAPGLQRNAGWAWVRGYEIVAPAGSVDCEEAATWLRIGRTCAYQLCRRYLATGGTDGVPCIRVGRLLRVPRHLLEQRFAITVTAVTPFDDLIDGGIAAEATVVALIHSMTSPVRRSRRLPAQQASLPFRL